MTASRTNQFELILKDEYERFQEGPGSWKTTIDKEPNESEIIIQAIKDDAKKKGFEIVEETERESTGNYKDKIVNIDLEGTDSPGWKYNRSGDPKEEPIANLDGPPDFQIVETLRILFGPGGVIIAFITALTPLLIKWIDNRATRSIKIRKGDVEIELKGENDILKALQPIQELIETTSVKEEKISQPSSSAER